MKEYIQKVSGGNNLSIEEASSAMEIIMSGNATDAQIAAFLVAMKMKGETPEELLGFVNIMREKSIKITLEDPDAVDLCGTGGDGSQTFNISTVASIVVAGAGVTVAKHGNRSISSSCGSADVLKALGVNIEITPEKVEACINTVGIGFLFAPVFHPAMKYAGKARSELGIKTCFNMLGPMTNPAGVKRQIVGTFSMLAAEKIAQVYIHLKPVHVCVLHSQDGLDEISLGAKTDIREIGETIREFSISHSEFGLSQASGSSIPGDSPQSNASITMRILEGEKGAYRDYVLANSAMALYVAGKASSPSEGIPIAEESIDSGKALKKLQQLIAFCSQ